MGCIWFDVCWCYVAVWLWWCGIRMQAEVLVLQLAYGYFTQLYVVLLGQTDRKWGFFGSERESILFCWVKTIYCSALLPWILEFHSVV